MKLTNRFLKWIVSSCIEAYNQGYARGGPFWGRLFFVGWVVILAGRPLVIVFVLLEFLGVFAL